MKPSENTSRPGITPDPVDCDCKGYPGQENRMHRKHANDICLARTAANILYYIKECENKIAKEGAKFKAPLDDTKDYNAYVKEVELERNKKIRHCVEHYKHRFNKYGDAWMAEYLREKEIMCHPNDLVMKEYVQYLEEQDRMGLARRELENLEAGA